MKKIYEKSLCFPLSFAVNLNHSKRKVLTKEYWKMTANMHKMQTVSDDAMIPPLDFQVLVQLLPLECGQDWLLNF